MSLGAFAAFLVLLFYVGSAALTTHECTEWRWSPVPVKTITGWHPEGDVIVKCFEGQVVDYRTDGGR